jgi:hypothetical protein
MSSRPSFDRNTACLPRNGDAAHLTAVTPISTHRFNSMNSCDDDDGQNFSGRFARYRIRAVLQPFGGRSVIRCYDANQIRTLYDNAPTRRISPQ